MDDIRVIDLPQITDPVGATLLYAVTDYLGTPVEGFIADTDLGKFIGKIGKLNITQPATTATLAIADGKTLTASNTLTLAGTDGSTLNIGTGGTLGTAAYTPATAYEVPLTFSTGLTRIGNTITATGSGSVSSVGLVGTANQVTVTGTSPITSSGSWTLSIPALAQLSIAKLTNLTGNGFLKTSASDGTLSIDTATYLTTAVTSIAGTANQVAVSASTGAVTVSIPASAQLSVAKLTNLTTNGLVTTSAGDGTLGITTPGTGVLTALAVNVGSAGAFVVNGGALGTPSSGTLTNATGLPAAGVTGTAVVQARSISTTSPLSGGGDLSADRTLSIANAAADGSTKGAAAFNATNFSASSGVINTIQDIATSSTPQFTRLGIGSAADGTAKLRVVQTANATPMILGYRQTDTSPTGAFIDLKNAAGDTSIFTVGVTGAISVGTIPIGSVSGLGTGIATALAVNTDSAGAPVLFNGALGTPSSGTLTSATGLPISTGVSGLGTGVATALAVNVGSAGAFVTFNGAGGTPSSLTLTNATGLPVGSITGLGTGVGAWLATPSSANLAAAITDETGSGALVFGTSPTITTSLITVYNATDTVGAIHSFKKARGTGSTVIVTGDTLGNLDFYGYDGSNQLLMGQIIVNSAGTIASTRVPTTMLFKTATNAAPSVLTTALTLGSNQDATFAAKIITSSGSITSTANNILMTIGAANFQFNNNTNNAILYVDYVGFDYATGDVCINRISSGVLGVTNGTALSLRDLKLRSLIGTAPSQFISTGAAAVSGNATLVAGTVTVSTTAAVTASLILLTRKTSGGTIGTAITYTISNGVSFTINSDNILDTSTFSWVIVNTF